MRHYKKGEYRDQFIIAYITDLDNCDDVVKWSEKLALMLNKGIILLHISDPQYTPLSTSEAEVKLKKINEKINIPLSHSYAAVKGKTKDIIHSVGDLLNGVVIVSKVLNSKNDNNKTSPLSVKSILKNFSTSRLAYFVFSSEYTEQNFEEVILSMNALKESKEKVLWASYFGRFSHSRINIFYHRYKDEYLQKQLNLNIGFCRKMFKNFKIETLNVHILNRKKNIDLQAIEYAEEKEKNLCIFQTTNNKSIVDFLFGSSEEKVLKTMQKVPVLFLNQRDDIFVMCE
ncbi:MAG: hypothetical protein IJ213_02610 [Bacteroidales bacterium]|nr:hypothetical protein [Bacteroidales bacterium]